MVLSSLDSFKKVPGEEAVVLFMFQQDHPPPPTTSPTSTWSPGFKGPARLVIDFKGKDPNSNSQEPGRTGRTFGQLKHNKWRSSSYPQGFSSPHRLSECCLPTLLFIFPSHFLFTGNSRLPLAGYGYCGETFFPKTEASEAQAQSWQSVGLKNRFPWAKPNPLSPNCEGGRNHPLNETINIRDKEIQQLKPPLRWRSKLNS